MNVIAFALQLHQLRFKVRADLGENMSELLNRLAVEVATTVFGHKDQMNMHSGHTMSAVSKVVNVYHRPEHAGTMLRLQAYKFEMMPNGEQIRLLRQFAGKLGWMRYRKSQDVLGAAANISLSESCGKWFASIQTEREVERPKHPSDTSIGLDWGVTRFFTLSDGQYGNQLAPLQAFLPKLAKLQRWLARKKKFSSNWKKVKSRITKLHSKIANIRKDFVNKASNSISKNHAIVCIEDLQVKNMSAAAAGTKHKPGKNVRAKSRLNRSILDASPFQLRRQLEYKTVWRGGLLIAVPPQNTSRFCPCCEHVGKDNRKSQSEFVCLACGFSAHADWVGAINIKRLGIASLVCSWSSGAVSPSWQKPTESIHAQARN
jgi:putative transposase